MSTYVIGDLQGCLTSFKRLLEKVRFDPAKDTLWLTGDLANRGPQPLETLRFIYSLRDHIVCVLGNHDLALLALDLALLQPHPKDTQCEILEAPDKKTLLEWLRQRPLLHREKEYLLVHAGIHPSWSIGEAVGYAQLVEQALRGPEYAHFLKGLFLKSEGSFESQDPIERARFILNCFTRMRFCRADGSLELSVKDTGTAQGLFPWFDMPARVEWKERILFGHWSALKGKVSSPQFIALDTGCVWGGSLTAFCIEDGQRFELPCGVS